MSLTGYQLASSCGIIFLWACLNACGGSAGGVRAIEAAAVDGGATAALQVSCSGYCADIATRLSEADVERILAQVVAEAEARNQPGTIAVVDRVGNVLAVYQMHDAKPLVTISSSFEIGAPIAGGLEGVNVVPATLAAISKAQTGAYLSTEGNAFTTRTASQIIQENFNPGEVNQPSGPLFGVQFSQLPCGDFVSRAAVSQGTVPGPLRAPLGLSADPGGFPLYKSGTPVGGIGFIGDGIYGLDKQISGFDQDLDEVIALAGTVSYAAPLDRRGDVITAAGKTLRYSDWSVSELVSDSLTDSSSLADWLQSRGNLTAVTGYYDGLALHPGTAFGHADSGILPALAGQFENSDGEFLDAFVFVDAAGNNRYPSRPAQDAPDGLEEHALSQKEVHTILREALVIANQSRAQIRRPLGTPARVTVSVVDSVGQIVGMVRSRDAPVFGADVSIQKARTAVFFSSSGQSISPSSSEALKSLPEPKYLAPVSDLATLSNNVAQGLVPALLQTSPLMSPETSFSSYVRNLQQFLGLPLALERDGTPRAFSDRAGGNLSRPHYPDGVASKPNGPLSKPVGQWSIFSVGLQSDLVYNALIHHVAHVALEGAIEDVGKSCVGNTGFNPEALFQTKMGLPRIANGLQIFPGSVPIFRGNTLIGGVGVSGDGVDQDDMIAFLSVHNASMSLSGALGNAPKEIRADQIALPNNLQRLRYVSCPQSPFIDSEEDNVCDGI
ncbi:MAG: heme-binding protein [Pseudomonadales bacterium]|nr:heme-binding protein [Pseudomonadales bacterium]